MQTAFSYALTSVGQIISLFTQEPFVYFVAVALVGAVASVARKFVPMRRG